MDYTGKADDYNRHIIDWHSRPVEKVMNFLKAKNPEVSKFELMLDAGCGGGKSTAVYAPYFRSIIGFDPSPDMIAKAKSLNNHGNINYVVGAGEAMPAKDATVDLIVSAFAVQHMDLSKFVDECNRVLQPNGCAALYAFEYTDMRSGSFDAPSGIELYRKHWYLPIKKYFQERNQLDASSYDRYSTIFNEIKGMKKTRGEPVTFDHSWTLRDMKDMYRAIPFPKEFYESMKENPIDAFANDLKDLWKIPGQSDEDVHLITTISIFTIFLTKP